MPNHAPNLSKRAMQGKQAYPLPLASIEALNHAKRFKSILDT